MASPLNTLVNGNAGTLREAADFLRGAKQATDAAADHARKAGRLAESSWHGPASDAFAVSTNHFSPDSADMSDLCGKYEQSFRDLADGLDAVNRKMADANDKATGGGLRLEGPLILPPDPPSPAPQVLPTGPCDTGLGRAAMNEQWAAVQDHNAAVSAYRAKARVFNECQGIVRDARRLERESHQAFHDAGGGSQNKPQDTLTQISTYAGYARGVVEGVENTRLTLMQKAASLDKAGTQFLYYARGQYGKLGPEFKSLLNWAARQNMTAADTYRTRASQYEKLVNKLGERTVKALTAYPGKPTGDALPRVSPKVDGVLRGLPYAGIATTVVLEARGAARGEQSWGKAVVDTGAVSAGGAVGGFLGGAFYGFMTGVPTGPGAILTGLAGGIIGGIAGQNVADRWVPE